MELSAPSLKCCRLLSLSYCFLAAQYFSNQTLLPAFIQKLSANHCEICEMKFRLLLSIIAFLKASLPFPIRIYMLISIILIFLWSRRHWSPLGFTVLVSNDLFCLAGFAVFLSVLLWYGSVSIWHGLGGGSFYPRMVHVPGKEQPALLVLPACPWGALWRLCLGRCSWLDFSWGAHQLFSYGKMLCKDNMEELCDIEMLLFKDRYLQCFCSVWGHFHRYTKQLVCTWFASKKPFAHE